MIPYTRHTMIHDYTFPAAFRAKAPRGECTTTFLANGAASVGGRSDRGMILNFLTRYCASSQRSDECVKFVSRTAMPDFFTNFSREPEMPPPNPPPVVEPARENELSSWNRAAKYLATHRECLEIAAIYSLNRVLQRCNLPRNAEKCLDQSSLSAAL